MLVYHFFAGKVVVDSWCRRFFVLSGFLITAILMKELNRTSTVNLKFWLRRTRRLLPAIVLSFGLYYLWQHCRSDALVGIKRQVFGAVTFSYNWVQILWYKLLYSTYA